MHRDGDLLAEFLYDSLGREYAYDNAGRIQSISDRHHGTQHYHYDSRHQLSRVEGALSERFAFDPAGNIIQQNFRPAATDRGNRLRFHGDRHFEYDERGNLVRERRGQNGKLVTDYHYNGFNQLTEVSRNGERIARYAYDALGRRVIKQTETGTTQYLWDGDTLYGEHGPPRFNTLVRNFLIRRRGDSKNVATPPR